MKTKLLYVLILSMLLCSCDKGGLMEDTPLGPSEWTTAKVAVVLPLSGEDNDKVRYERIYKMFEENVIKAQIGLPEGVKLELEWYDENTLDIRKFANELYYREDIKTLIGPLKDNNIETIASVIYNKGIPMFVMSSSEEIIRRFSSGTAGVSVKKPFMWSLSEIDIVQARIILAKAGAMGRKKVSVISADNKYGNTFNNWVPHYADEMKLDVIETLKYSDTHELENNFDRICKGETEALICALNNIDDAKKVLEIAKKTPDSPKIFFTGAVLNTSLLESGSLVEGAEGFSIYPAPYTGFHLSYQVRFGETPMPIDAQLYDTFLLSLISFAYCHYSGNGMTLNEALAMLSDLPLSKEEEFFEDVFWETTPPIWDYAGLRDGVLEPIRNGKLPELNLVGASGNFKFAADSYTSLAKGTYINWTVNNGKLIPLDFIDEKGSRQSSYINAWDWILTMDELENGSDYEYIPTLPEGNKAILICGSEGWYNYRHQADILYVYNRLKKYKFTDDDIILIMRDDIAYHPKNTDKGAIRISPDGENLYHDVVIDYRADTLSIQDIEDIIVGNKSERLSTVLESTDTDNVLLYWTGHGTEKSFNWLETGEKFTDVQMGETVRKLYEDKKYQSMLICTEPCYSGSVIQAIEGTPLVLGITAANNNESSYAENFNNELGVWMCDRFTLNLMRIYEEYPYIDLLGTIKMLRESTLGSNVQVYNSQKFYYLDDCLLMTYFETFK